MTNDTQGMPTLTPNQKLCWSSTVDALLFRIENGKKRENNLVGVIYILTPKHKLCFLNGAEQGDVVL